MNPVRGAAMINFLQWLTEHHPEIRRLKDRSKEDLLRLANEFEGGKLDGNFQLTEKWKNGFWALLESNSSWGDYEQARRKLQQIEH